MMVGRLEDDPFLVGALHIFRLRTVKTSREESGILNTFPIRCFLQFGLLIELKKQEPNVHVWRRSGAGDPGAGAGVGGDYTLQVRQTKHPSWSSLHHNTLRLFRVYIGDYTIRSYGNEAKQL